MWKYIRQYLFFAVLAGLFMVGEVMMDLIQPGLMSKIVDNGVLGLDRGGVGDLSLVWHLGFRMILLVLFGGFCGSMNNVFVHMSGQNIGNEIRKDCFRRIMTFSFPQLDGFGTGSLVTRVTNDITQVQNFVSQFVRGMIRTSMLTFGSMYFMFRLNIAAFGGYFSVNGLISVGVISAFIVYAKQFSRPINEIAQVYGQLQTAVAGAERVFMVLDEKDEEQSGQRIHRAKKAEVRFKNVRFSYVQGQPVLHDFTLTVPSGKKVALVGATGSGKTTVVNLLMRFYDIDSGDIFLNQQNIREIARKELRKKVAIVLQDTVLFSDTVFNNLRYGNGDAGMKEVEEAAGRSRCREMIEMLPKGYDTALTGSGENISQGQRQLLAIARAFVADPEILILDEATSNVDTRTEKAIQDAMHLVMQNRTSIVIAHRLSTIRDADMIVVMDHGRIVEMGDHDVLLSKRGKYYDLYMTQYAGIAI